MIPELRNAVRSKKKSQGQMIQNKTIKNATDVYFAKESQPTYSIPRKKAKETEKKEEQARDKEQEAGYSSTNN